MSKNRFLGIIIIVISISLTISSAYGYDDNFGQAQVIKGKHFTVYYAPRVDIFSLVQELNIGPAEKILAGKSTESNSSPETELTDMLDTLFLRVGEILDMRLFSFKGTIKICRDSQHLNSIYRDLFGRDLTSPSLYIYTFNTIYTSPEGFKRQILGHEIAHAVISNYFVVQPPEKVAEVLAGYVEYQLRKAR